jgi:methionyl-tRNA formyltransferase
MTNTHPIKIILVCTDCDYTRILFHGIKNDIVIDKVIMEKPVSKKKLIQRRIKKLGLSRVFGQLLFQGGVVPVIRLFSKNKVSKLVAVRGLDISPVPEDLVVRVSSVNDQSFITVLAAINPGLIIVNGTRIISSQTLGYIKCPVINVHVGITPLYRGVHGAYWALANKDRQHCGVTVHAIDKGIDTGGILQQDIIEPCPRDNFITYPYLQFEKAIQLVKNIVPRLLQEKIPFLPAPPGVSKLWYHPTIWQYIANRFKGIK